jgi:hypothetical protein
MENEDLDDILNGAPQPEAPPEVAQAEAEAQAGPPRDEHGRFAPKGEMEAAEPPQAAPPAATDDEGPPIPRKALLDERSKRQALEAELQRAREQLQAFQYPPQAPPSIFDDEQGWEQHFGQTVVQQAVSQATQNARLDMSEMMVRQAHPDFEEKKAAFLEAMQATPGLAERARQDPHPWNFAYQYVVNQQRMNELSAVNVADLEAKLRAQIQAEYEAKAGGALQASLPAGVPPSLSGQRNVGSRQGPAWAGPSPLSDILNRP